jgi:hypothetical protein
MQKYKDTLGQKFIHFEKKYKGEKANVDTNNWCYVIYNPLTKLTKIGVTTVCLKSRKRALERQSGNELIIFCAVNLIPEVEMTCGALESFLHNELKSHRIKHGEWFNLKYITLCRIYDLMAQLGDDFEWNEIY